MILARCNATKLELALLWVFNFFGGSMSLLNLGRNFNGNLVKGVESLGFYMRSVDFTNLARISFLWLVRDFKKNAGQD